MVSGSTLPPSSASALIVRRRDATPVREGAARPPLLLLLLHPPTGRATRTTGTLHGTIWSVACGYCWVVGEGRHRRREQKLKRTANRGSSTSPCGHDAAAEPRRSSGGTKADRRVRRLPYGLPVRRRAPRSL
eukprot:scaffold1068_cov375-Prasinococcus_capsulatus_cf.AAC.18